MPISSTRRSQVAGPVSNGAEAPVHGSPRAPPMFPVVAVGASAGGLEACTKLFDTLSASPDMAFVLILHLDPNHESMMGELLARHTTLIVRQAADGLVLEPGHLYIIEPRTYLALENGMLRVCAPQAPHGSRLPFDFFLLSLAQQYGARSACVILSGSGADGSVGLRAVREQGGLVIAQDPAEAAYDGMPRSAIETGSVQFVLHIAEMADALGNHDWNGVGESTPQGKDTPHDVPATAALASIISLLREKTPHDFTSYKRGTLQRRIERRMAMASIHAAKMDRYLDILRNDTQEAALLAKDLLINVTSFFRDPQVFGLLEQQFIPNLVRNQPPGRPIRIWIAGCSTGEETYSLGILFIEQIALNKRNIKLQIFASDVDADAVASAREGVYNESIEHDISATRLARFFSKEDERYTVVPELRECVVFTTQDVLADPPFSRLDLVSCRNLLIYLRPEAQAKVVSLFHFALRDDGLLLLGTAETVGSIDTGFAVAAKSERLYRKVGHSRPGESLFQMASTEGVRTPTRVSLNLPPSQQHALAELCRRLVMEAYAPAAVLINQKHECLYSLGPTERYLRVAPGYATHDLLAMVPSATRIRLRSAIERASREGINVSVTGKRHEKDAAIAFSMVVQPVVSKTETLLLICFLDTPKPTRARESATHVVDVSRVADLERELETTQAELQRAIRELDLSGEEQKAINEEALSVNEEYQSANEELLTSKEELQSLNEELTALNSQLQETLERQRTTSNDLQNVLYSTDVATLFLDTELHIRFFTPATKLLFSVIPSDIGRPLSDLSSLAIDGALIADARTVMRTRAPIECEVETQQGIWFTRRILPYRTHDDGVEGVVITFTDITEQTHVAQALEAAKHQAELATVAKSRFLAAASHDLRQPLQTLALLQDLLAKSVDGERTQGLVDRFGDTLGAMSSMLNTLLDINQIEAGTVRSEIVEFPIDDLLQRLKDEFAFHAQAQGLELHVVACSVSVRSDIRLLEQILRNLLANALKYTRKGKVLLGCRRRRGMLSIEVWDTGIGIPEAELQTIFEEYHQLDNPAREHSKGLGLGLSIVQRLADLLGHTLHVRSKLERGSAFSVQVARATGEVQWHNPPHEHGTLPLAVDNERLSGAILVIDDDPEIRALFELLLTDEGHRVRTAANSNAALAIVAEGIFQPDLILSDYNLPQELNGLQLVASLREQLGRAIAAIIVTGDISTQTLRAVSRQDCVTLNKPVKPGVLLQVIQRLLARTRKPLNTEREASARPGEISIPATRSTVYVVDDDSNVRQAARSVLEDGGHTVETYATCEAFLEGYRPSEEACLLVDAYLPGMTGLELLERLDTEAHRLPAIMITGSSDVPMAVHAMKAGAIDFIEKPIGGPELLDSVARALDQGRDSNKLVAWRASAAQHIAELTPRQREVMERVLAGQPSKNIASELGISQRTVENHRASIMKKTGSKSLPALARLALAATVGAVDEATAPTRSGS
jgi:two-component system, chemotaxis family, CheB/CheR fusion protein